MDQFFSRDTFLDYFAKVRENGTIFRTCLILGDSSNWLTSIAWEVSSVLLCPNFSTHPPFYCGECSHCSKIKFRTHPDVKLVEPTEERNIVSIDDIREIKTEAHTQPWEAEYRIFIIKNADGMQDAGGNSLLKLLEEPPNHCIFFLTSRNEQSVLETILSRCQKFRIISDTKEDVSVLTEKCKLTQEQAQTILRINNYSLPASLEMFETTWKYRVSFLKSCIEREDPIKMLATLLGKSSADKNAWFRKEEGETQKVSPEEVFSYFISFWHDIMLCQYMPYKQDYVTNLDFIQEIQNIANRLFPSRVERFLDRSLSMLPHILRSQPKIFWSSFLVSSYIQLAETSSHP